MRKTLITNHVQYEVVLETLLTGHNGWVYDCRWCPGSGSPTLLTASMDRTLVLWRPDPETGLWLDNTRMGDAGGTHVLGFFGAVWGAKFHPTIS